MPSIPKVFKIMNLHMYMSKKEMLLVKFGLSRPLKYLISKVSAVRNKIALWILLKPILTIL